MTATAVAPTPSTDRYAHLAGLISDFEKKYPASKDLKTDIGEFLGHLKEAIGALSTNGKDDVTKACCDLIDNILRSPDVELRGKLGVLADALANRDPLEDDFVPSVANRMGICS